MTKFGSSKHNYADQHLKNLDFTLASRVAEKYTLHRALVERALNLAGYSALFMALAVFSIFRRHALGAMHGESSSEILPPQLSATDYLGLTVLMAMIVLPLVSYSPRKARAGLLPSALAFGVLMLGFLAIDFTSFWWISGESRFVVWALIVAMLMICLFYPIVLSIRRARATIGTPDLRNALFQNCRIEKCDFTGSYYSGARFVNCEFDGCGWHWADLSHARICTSSFAGCWFWVNMHGPETFSDCKFRQCVILFCSVENPSFLQEWSGTLIRTRQFVWFARGSFSRNRFGSS